MKPTILAIGGHDPTGGAGIQADIETIAALGGHPITLVTALTAQDTQGVQSFTPVDPDLLRQQADLLLTDLPVDAVKIGMVGTAKMAKTVGSLLARISTTQPEIPVVLDPVLAGGGSGSLSKNSVQQAIREFLLPHTTIATPNRAETRKLFPEIGANSSDFQRHSQAICATGCKNVLITGTDSPLEGENPQQVRHVLQTESGEFHSFSFPRLPHSYHGSGCTLASAIAMQLAQNRPMVETVERALQYTWKMLEAGFQPGKGQHLPNRFLGN